MLSTLRVGLQPFRLRLHSQRLQLQVQCTQRLTLPVRVLHSSPVRCAPPIILVALMKPLMKVATALTARAASRRWRKASPESRARVQRYFADRKRWLAAAGLGCVAGCLGYYAWHLERVPLTGRLRVVTVSEARLNEYSHLELAGIFESAGETVLPAEHPYTRRVAEVATSLLPAACGYFSNSPEQWKVHVVQDDTIVNAVCFSTGDILVYSGMLKFVENDHQLAFVLAHEMSHVLIGHSREHLTFGNALYCFVLLPLTALTWYFVPDLIAALGYAVQDKLVNLFFHMPFGRKLELEADAVGLKIAAASCYDPREAARFWELMDFLEEANNVRVPAFLSTHPLSTDRARELRSQQEAAMSVRSSCNCPPLGQRRRLKDPAYGALKSAMLSFAARLRLISAGNKPA